LVALRNLLPGAKRRRPKPRKKGDGALSFITPPRDAPPAQRLDAARDLLKSEIPPKPDDA